MLFNKIIKMGPRQKYRRGHNIGAANMAPSFQLGLLIIILLSDILFSYPLTLSKRYRIL